MNERKQIEELVEELRLQVPFKDSFEVGDLFLMLTVSPKGKVINRYGYVTEIKRPPDTSDKWRHVSVVFLEMPPQAGVLFLSTAQWLGQEIFTLAEDKVFMKAVNLQTLIHQEDDPPSPDPHPDHCLRKSALTLVKYMAKGKAI